MLWLVMSNLTRVMARGGAGLPWMGGPILYIRDTKTINIYKTHTTNPSKTVCIILINVERQR